MSYTGTMNEVTEAPVDEWADEQAEEQKHPLHRELNAGDRCESYMSLRQYGADNGSCGAQAFFLVVIPHSGDKETDLVFCAHHFTKSESKLREVATYISDQTAEKLNIAASASSPD